MKKIMGLDKPVRIIEAKKSDTIPPTMREVLLTELSMENSIRGPKTIRLTGLGLKIMDAGADVELEDADFDLLKEVLGNPKHVRGIPVGFSSAVIGAIEIKLGEVK